MCTTKQYIANVGVTNISVANPNLNGTGTIATVLTSGNDGTEVNNITIKATASTSVGMVRLYIETSQVYQLYKEISIPAVTQTPVIKTFQTTIVDKITLNPGQKLCASTQNAESFNVIANGIDWISCPCTTNTGACCNDTQHIAHTGINQISVANSNLNGTGAMSNIISGATGPIGIGGTMVSSVSVKATGSTTEGMVRLFVNNGTTSYLMKEIYIPATTQTSVQPSQRTKALVRIFLNPSYSIFASTQNANTFNVFTYASDWVNCPCL